MKPVQIKDKSHLHEIYNLRVIAYENSPNAVYVNRKLYPNGWFDELDELDGTVHWVIRDNNKIIAAARLVILDDMSLLGEAFNSIELPKEAPFAYWSRLVVHPDYRRTRAMMLLDRIRKEYIVNHLEIKFAISCVIEARSKSLLRQGFECIGELMYSWGAESKDKIMLLHILKMHQSVLSTNSNHATVIRM